jgi:hypothetical protein
MDDELRTYLDAMKADLGARLDASNADLIGKINIGNERILDRLTTVEGEVRNLRTLAETTQEFVLKSPGLIVQSLQKPLLDRLAAVEARVKKLEGDDPAPPR